MYKKLITHKSKVKVVSGMSLLLTISSTTLGQVAIDGQLRGRGEVRNGTGTLRPVTYDAAAFISQRTRLNFNYKWTRLNFRASIQDVRVWGQDASTISMADGNRLTVHEAWADVILSNKKDSTFKSSPFEFLSTKLGRQEIVYDDARLLGNLDWLQQGRRHDAVILKLVQKGWQIDLGAAFNQNTDAFNYNGTYYTPANINATVKDSKGNLVNTPTGLIPLVNASGLSSKNGSPAFNGPISTNAATQNYKSFEYLYVAKGFNKLKLSGLFFMDQFAKYRLDSVANSAGSDAAYVYGRRFNQKGTNNRFTTGLFLTAPIGSKTQWMLNASAYYQGGKDRDGLDLSAYMATFSIGYNRALFNYSIGLDYLSGNDASTPTTENRRFDPLYGTPHKFWGLMDYFYAGTGAPVGGLSNPFAKIKYSSKNKRFVSNLDYHYFAFANDRLDAAGNPLKAYLGSEIDFINSYTLNKITAVELGLAYLAATRSMEYAKGVTPNSTKLNNTWAYLQINIKPDFLSK
ncbi:alginate export family protein [Pedobacter sp. SYSU D00535]|uniref:alginate export family protein n=1 Tax=Pedobacter sp. SYSU D00535 TaxID=2810308 RepID=UPI001A96AE61|nr:alginate export family protein [Pedobacter sp. SYSU D00535]